MSQKKNFKYTESVRYLFFGFTLYNREDFVFGEPIADALRQGYKHLHPQLPSYSTLPFQKVTLSIIPYHFTIQLTSQLLFSYSTH